MGVLSDIGQFEGVSGATGALTDVRGRTPDPFFDISRMYLPEDIHTVFQWCKYYTLTHPIVAAVIHKRSSYPITDLIVRGKDERAAERWETLLQYWDSRVFSVMCLLDRNAFGNCFVWIQYPIRKVLICRSCGAQVLAPSARYRFQSGKFQMDCPKCGNLGYAKVTDYYLRNARGIQLLRLTPARMDILAHDGLPVRYFYTLSTRLVNDIKIGRRNVVENLPQVFIDAAYATGVVELNPEHLIHLKRGTITTDDYAGWGEPLPFPVFRDAFLMRTLNRAQEALALDHVMPIRTISPRLDADPYSSINVGQFLTRIQEQIKAWRRDPLRFIFSPIPFLFEEHGGQGRRLLLNPEIRAQIEVICMGLQTPIEFLSGGVSFSGSTVSLRVLENAFIGDRTDIKALWNTIVRRVATYMSWPRAPIDMRFFKMADDIQRTVVDMQLHDRGLISDATLLENRDYDASTEAGRLSEEAPMAEERQVRRARAQARAQGEAQVVQMSYQRQLQPQMPQTPPGGPEQGPPGQQEAPMEEPAPLAQEDSGIPQEPMVAYDLEPLARQWVSYLSTLEGQTRQSELFRLKSENQQLYALVLERMHPAEEGVMRPLPEQLPPRRGAATAVI